MSYCLCRLCSLVPQRSTPRKRRSTVLSLEPLENRSLPSSSSMPFFSEFAPILLVEFNRKGDLVGSFQVDPGAPGAAFGITLSIHDHKLEFVAVNDNANTVEVFTLPLSADCPY